MNCRHIILFIVSFISVGLCFAQTNPSAVKEDFKPSWSINRVSLPRGHGEPLDVIKQFATWCAWKRGNEVLPHWAYPDSRLEDSLPPEKLSAVTMKKLDREAALEAALQAPRRQSTRRPSSQGAASVHSPARLVKAVISNSRKL